jgi:hypothetical protein
MRISSTSPPPIYPGNSPILYQSTDDFYLLITITSIFFFCFTISYCNKYIKNNCRNIDTVNNCRIIDTVNTEIRSRESTIDIDNKICRNSDNSNLSDDEHLPTYNEAVKDY